MITLITLVILILTTSVISAQDQDDVPCFPHDTVYVTGTMNVREAPTTRRAVLASAEKGDSFPVITSEAGDDWCWIDIDIGWIAHTRYVSGDITDILPPIEGGHWWFAAKIKLALEFLHDISPYWFDYVIDNIRSIEGDPDLKSFARVKVTTGHVKISSSHYTRRQSISTIASTLVHEACHMEQFKRGERARFSDIPLEKECYGVEARALTDIAPRNPHIKWSTCMSKNYPLQIICDN